MKRHLAVMCFIAFVTPVSCLPADAQSLTISELTPAVSIHTTYQNDTPANGLVYVNGSEAAIIDTPWTEAQTGELIDLLDARGVSVVAVIPTHWHEDCMGGLATAKQGGIPTYSLDMTADIARRKKLPIPKNTFTGTLSVKVGDATVVCRYFGGGHTADNSVVWIPEERVLFGGCMIKAMGATGLENLEDAVVPEWPETVQKVMIAYPDARFVVPGQGLHGDTGLFLHTLELLKQHSE